MERETIVAIVCVIIALVVALFIVDMFNPSFGFFAKVDAGHVGVVDHFGKVREETLQPGFHVTQYFEHVHPIDVRTQKTTYTTEAFSADIQQVIVTISINTNISPDAANVLYRTVGMNYKPSLVEPRLMEDAKVVISQYTAESLISNRETLSRQILAKMKEDVESYGILITQVSIENIDFTDAFEQAVEAKQVATQEKQRAKTQEEQKTMEAQQKAERDRIAAQTAADIKKIDADATAYNIKTQAEAQAAANRKVAETLSDELIRYNAVHQWDGKLPTITGDASPILNMTGLTE